MFRIIVNSCEWIAKNGRGFLEGHAMFPQVSGRLPRIPGEVHVVNLTCRTTRSSRGYVPKCYFVRAAMLPTRWAGTTQPCRRSMELATGRLPTADRSTL